jgi:hypothetical protein
MSLRHWLRRSTAWIALWAVCFGALAPTLSQAALQARGAEAGHWVQVCSASGISWVRAGGDEGGEGSTADATLSCPWGLMLSGAGADLPPSHSLVLPEAAPHALPLAQAQRGVAPAPSAHAPARAPPRGI